MEEVLDILWFKIVAGVHYIKELFDIVLSPLNSLGPAIAILFVAVMTVALTGFLTRTLKTKRYMQLQKEFRHWFNIRQEALKCEDPDKAKRLAKNIDKAKLNRVYYDYFFEGLLNNLATKYIPILILLAYDNEAYQPNNLLKLFGREYIFKFGQTNGDPILVGSAFWFVVSILFVYLAWFIAGNLYTKYITPKKQTL